MSNKKYKIVVTGAGGREHALSWKLSQSPDAEIVYTYPGNAGIPNSISDLQLKGLSFREWCVENKIDLIVAGPEIDLVRGLKNRFEGTGISVFGPDKTAAQLEASKIFSKTFMRKYGIPTADFKVFESEYSSAEVLDEIHRLDGNLVIKYDGLAAGKGVYVCDSIKQGVDAFNELRSLYGQTAPFIIEHKLTGTEISIIGITDGKSIKLFSPSQDHKRLLDGDEGPNTGGMGAYSPVKSCTDELLERITKEIVQKTVEGISSENLDYKGFIYFGIMMDENDNPFLLEYNVRLGDPEAEVILPRMKNDLLPVILNCLNGTLAESDIENNDGYCVDVVLVSGGYPKVYAARKPISGLTNPLLNDCHIFYSAVQRESNELYTSGGRVINVVAEGTTFEEARSKVYAACEAISFEDIFYRKDIGHRNL